MHRIRLAGNVEELGSNQRMSDQTVRAIEKSILDKRWFKVLFWTLIILYCVGVWGGVFYLFGRIF